MTVLGFTKNTTSTPPPETVIPNSIQDILSVLCCWNQYCGKPEYAEFTPESENEKRTNATHK